METVEPLEKTDPELAKIFQDICKKKSNVHKVLCTNDKLMITGFVTGANFNSYGTLNFKLEFPRNSPCPCGSGKKYKKCCGKTS